MTLVYNKTPSIAAIAGKAIKMTIAQIMILEIKPDLLFLLSFFTTSLHQLSK